MVRTNRSAYAFARGERIGGRMVSTPFEANTSSKLAVNLVSRSRMRNRNRRPASSRSEAKLRATCETHGQVRVGGGSEDVHDAALHFEDDQHVVAPKEDRVDVEEVRGHNALGPLGEEPGPGWALSPGGRWESVAAQHGRDARLRHGDAELLQLADDAEITPPGVLPSQAANQLHGLFGKTRTTWSAVRVGPALLDQRAVPAQDRRWADEERSPVFSRNKTGQEGDEGPVGPGEAGTGDLAVQHGQLVAEYEDLSVLGRGIHPMDANDLNDAPDGTVEKGQGHDQQASPSVLWLGEPGRGGFWPLNQRR